MAADGGRTTLLSPSQVGSSPRCRERLSRTSPTDRFNVTPKRFPDPPEPSYEGGQRMTTTESAFEVTEQGGVTTDVRDHVFLISRSDVR
jgi:hypothetical protein